MVDSDTAKLSVTVARQDVQEATLSIAAPVEKAYDSQRTAQQQSGDCQQHGWEQHNTAMHTTTA